LAYDRAGVAGRWSELGELRDVSAISAMRFAGMFRGQLTHMATHRRAWRTAGTTLQEANAPGATRSRPVDCLRIARGAPDRGRRTARPWRIARTGGSTSHAPRGRRSDVPRRCR